MNCPRCGHPKTKANPIPERTQEELCAIYRVRVCPKCLESFTTREIPFEEKLRDEIIIYGLLFYKKIAFLIIFCG